MAITSSEAKKRADKKYKSKLKQWQVRLKPEDFEAIETERNSRNLSRKEFLELLIKVN